MALNGIEWQRMAIARYRSLNGKPTFGYFLSFSSLRLLMPLYAIKGEARMLLNAIKQKSFPFSAFRFPFFANFAK